MNRSQLSPYARLLRRVAAAVLALGVLTVGLAEAPSAAPPALDGTVTLEAEGGMRFAIPSTWSKTRQDSTIAVVVRAPVDDDDATFQMLLLAVEAGATDPAVTDWDKVRANIVEAASGTYSKLELTLGEALTLDDGRLGRRLSGKLTAKDHALAVAMVAVATPGRLATVSVLGPPTDAEGAQLAEAVAKTVQPVVSK